MAIKTKLEDMEIGDMIACRYKAGGYFSELGTCVAPELPLAGSANPDGLFYFRKVDTGLCIADRVVQHSISWDALNGLGLIQGKETVIRTCPVLTSNDTDGELAFASSVYNVNFDAWKAFNDISDENNRWASSGTPPATLGRKFKHARKFRSYAVRFLDYGQSPLSWKLYGSMDDISYNELHSVSNDTTAASTTKKYIIPEVNRNEYLYYKIEVSTTKVSGNLVSIGELLFDPVVCLIRSLSGGNSYLDENGKSSLVDKGLGAFPPNNEWDEYVVKSTLNGTVTAGDNNVWHTNEAYSVAQDTPLYGVNVLGNVSASSGSRVYRGHYPSDTIRFFTHSPSSNAVDTGGFRPVLEYIESKSKATTLFY